MMITMLGTVLQAWGSQVLIRDNSNGEQVLVNLYAGDQVRIEFDGAMTASIPPQISAMSICVQRVY